MDSRLGVVATSQTAKIHRPVPATWPTTWNSTDSFAGLFRSLVEHQSDLVCLFEPDGLLRYVNQSYAAFHSRIAEDLMGTNFLELAPDGMKAIATAELAKTVAQISTTAEPLMVVIPMIDADGEERWFDWLTQPVFDDTGKLSVVASVGRDVTVHHRNRAKLQEMNFRLSESNRDLQDFAYVASHDLQEPLRKITAFSGRLESKLGPTLDDKNRDYLNRITGAAFRMQTLITDLLAVSRVATTGKALEPTMLSEVLVDVLSDLEVAIEKAGATIDVSMLPPVAADATQMRQLFQNLVGNALKFVDPETKPHIKISARAAHSSELPRILSGSTDQTFALISVSDNGIGIDDEHAEKIFTAFQRLHGRDEYDGSGIGLAVCKRIVDRHGGAIELAPSDTDSTGATFRLFLPCAKDELERAAKNL